MTFGWAIEQLKAGHRVARSGWNGKGMWLALTPGSTITSQGSHLRGAALHRSAELVAEHGDLSPRPMVIAPHIDMRAADGTMVIGWLASQTDMLAEDWHMVQDAS